MHLSWKERAHYDISPFGFEKNKKKESKIVELDY